MNNLDINDFLDIYFKRFESNDKYNDLFLSKIQPVFRQNIIKFLDEFIYQVSDDKFFQPFKKYFINNKYNHFNHEKYKAFAITTLIKHITDSNINILFNEKYKKLFRTKINNLTYDIYKIAYDSVYNYFYEYLNQCSYLVNGKKEIYEVIIYLTNQLINNFVSLEENLLSTYMKIYCNTNYLLIQFHDEDNNNLQGYNVLQSHSKLINAIEALDQYIEFEFRVNPTDIYYNNLIYNNHNKNVGIILSDQKFDMLLDMK